MTPKSKAICIMLVTICMLALTAGEFENTTVELNITPYATPNSSVIIQPLPVATPTANPDIDGKGTLEVIVRCANNIFSKEMMISQSDNVRPINTIYLNPNGKYEDRYFPGTYLIYLLDGNGGKPEFATATVYTGYQTRVAFLGHAITPHHNTTISNNTQIPVPTQTPFINPECLHRPDLCTQPTPTPTTNPECQHRPTAYGCPDYEPCIRMWHDGWWETESQWTCKSPDGESIELSCCKWVNVPVWHDGYWYEACQV